jgi:hypothetical protein
LVVVVLTGDFALLERIHGKAIDGVHLGLPEVIYLDVRSKVLGQLDREPWLSASGTGYVVTCGEKGVRAYALSGSAVLYIDPLRPMGKVCIVRNRSGKLTIRCDAETVEVPWDFEALVELFRGHPGAGQSSAVVPSEQLSAFLDIVRSGDFHRMRREGEKIFQTGRYVPDHASRFKDFSVFEPQPGVLRYGIFSIKGEAGAASISLFLDKATGKIIEFSPVDVSF